MREKEKAKIKKIAEETKPTLEEQTRFREELELVWKNNALYKQDQQLNKIQMKHDKRMMYLEKNIEEKKKV